MNGAHIMIKSCVYFVGDHDDESARIVLNGVDSKRLVRLIQGIREGRDPPNDRVIRIT